MWDVRQFAWRDEVRQFGCGGEGSYRMPLVSMQTGSMLPSMILIVRRYKKAKETQCAAYNKQNRIMVKVAAL